jgi:hypothetical protein
MATLLLPPLCLMNIYSLIIRRHILSKTHRSRLRLYSSSSIPPIHATTASRPYTFHIGASWAGKPDDNPIKIKAAFPPDTVIGTWRDKTLSRPKAVRSRDAGEDFFFVQEVLLHPYNYATLNSLKIDAESIGKLSTHWFSSKPVPRLTCSSVWRVYLSVLLTV